MKPDPSISRRDFIKVSTNTLLALSGLAGLGALVRFFSYEPAPETPTRFEVGSLDSYPEGSRTLREEIPALIVNDAGSIAAYSLVCPHLGCTVEAGADGFTCPCHGSRFDADGKVLQGPAQKGLGRLRVEVIEGSVIVHTD